MQSSKPAASSTASSPAKSFEVEQLPADVGAAMSFDQVLMVGDGDERQGRRAAGVRRRGHGQGRRARPRREGAHLQDAPPQALPEDRRATGRTTPRSASTTSSRGKAPWHTRKQAAVRATAATPSRSAWASRSTAASWSTPAASSCASAAREVHPGRERRHGPRPHAVRARRRARSSSRSRARQASKTVSVVAGVSRSLATAKSPVGPTGLFCFSEHHEIHRRSQDRGPRRQGRRRLGLASAARSSCRAAAPTAATAGAAAASGRVADRNINTLIDYRYARIHRAKNGENGRGRGLQRQAAPRTSCCACRWAP